MSELDQIRQRRMEELQAQAQQQQELQQQVQQLEAVVRTMLTKEALQRYGNLKAAHPDKAIQLLALVGQQIQSGKARKITDEDLKRMLIMLTPKAKQIKITRK